MTDEASAAVKRLEIELDAIDRLPPLSRRSARARLWESDARALLSHLAAKDAEIAELRAAKERAEKAHESTRDELWKTQDMLAAEQRSHERTGQSATECRARAEAAEAREAALREALEKINLKCVAFGVRPTDGYAKIQDIAVAALNRTLAAPGDKS